MERNKVFEQELSYIKDKNIKESAITIINLLPDYFFHAEASTSTKTKHHPSFALGDGGLVRHTKVAVRIAYELFSNKTFGEKYTSLEQDLIIMGLLIHDGIKQGLNNTDGHTVKEHPTLIKNFILANKGQLFLDDNQIKFLTKIVESHMGPWNTDLDGKEILPIPNTKYEKFVHLCDYLASRKFLDVKFNQNDEIMDNNHLKIKNNKIFN